MQIFVSFSFKKYLGPNLQKQIEASAYQVRQGKLQIIIYDSGMLILVLVLVLRVEPCAGRAAPPPSTICVRRRRRLLLIGAPPPIICRRVADTIVAA